MNSSFTPWDEKVRLHKREARGLKQKLWNWMNDFDEIFHHLAAKKLNYQHEMVEY